MRRTFQWVAAVVFFCMPGIHDTQAQNKQVAVKEVSVDDFEDGNVVSQLGGVWIAATDRDEGGNSHASLQVAGSGYLSKKAIHFKYRRGERYRHKAEGVWKDAFALLALNLSENWGQTRDISQFQGFTCELKGRGTYTLLASCKGDDGMQIFYKTLPVEENGWKKIQIDFSELRPLGNPDSQSTFATSTAMLIGFSHAGSEKQNDGEFWLDDLVFYGDAPAVESKRQPPEEIRFGNLLIYKPAAGWSWEPEKELSKLVAKLKGTTMVFVGLPMANKNRIPFSDGLSADPGNPRELLECTIYELRKMGLQNLKPVDSERVQLKNFSCQRFVLRGEFPAAVKDELKKMGWRDERAFVQVDFIKHRSITYEIVSLMPEQVAKEMVPQVRAILYELAPHK